MQASPTDRCSEVWMAVLLFLLLAHQGRAGKAGRFEAALLGGARQGFVGVSRQICQVGARDPQ